MYIINKYVTEIISIVIDGSAKKSLGQRGLIYCNRKGAGNGICASSLIN